MATGTSPNSQQPGSYAVGQQTVQIGQERYVIANPMSSQYDRMYVSGMSG